MKKEASAPENQFGNVPVTWDEQRKRWLLTTYFDKKRARKFFQKKEDALKEWRSHCHRVERHGPHAAEYNAAAHREYAEAKRIAGGLDLRDIARAYMEKIHTVGESKTVTDAVVEFLAAKKEREVSSRHLASLKTYLEKLKTAFGEKPLREVSGNKLFYWLIELKRVANLEPVTVKNYHRNLAVFFNWCVRRKYIAESPSDDVHDSDLPVIPEKPKGVLSVAQCAGMMAWLETERPHFVAWHAVQLFAGIRSAEAGRLRREYFDFEKRVLTIPGWVFEKSETSKTTATRVVKTGDAWALHGLPANLWTWLEKYFADGETIRVPAHAALDRMRRKRFPELSPAIVEWPHNAMRHTFCTMMISLHESADKVANWSRHTNTRVLYDNYVAKLVSKDDAQRFCEIVPCLK